MSNKTLLVVSDKFHHFTTRKDVITKSELYDLVNSKDLSLPRIGNIFLIPGQGFSESVIGEIITIITASCNSKYFDISMWRKIPSRASKKLTHKHNDENILISTPKRDSEEQFSMDVLIDEECEMMRDHQTGLHIQGMILVEASRQACMSVIEKFLLTDTEENLYFVFNNLHVKYNRFAFPLPSTLQITLKKHDRSKEKRKHFILDVDVIQCGNVSASLSLDGTMMSDKRVLSMESRFANQSLDNYISQAIAENNIVHNYKEANNA